MLTPNVWKRCRGKGADNPPTVNPTWGCPRSFSYSSTIVLKWNFHGIAGFWSYWSSHWVEPKHLSISVSGKMDESKRTPANCKPKRAVIIFKLSFVSCKDRCLTISLWSLLAQWDSDMAGIPTKSKAVKEALKQFCEQNIYNKIWKQCIYRNIVI